MRATLSTCIDQEPKTSLSELALLKVEAEAIVVEVEAEAKGAMGGDRSDPPICHMSHAAGKVFFGGAPHSCHPLSTRSRVVTPLRNFAVRC